MLLTRGKTNRRDDKNMWEIYVDKKKEKFGAGSV